VSPVFLVQVPQFFNLLPDAAHPLRNVLIVHALIIRPIAQLKRFTSIPLVKP